MTYEQTCLRVSRYIYVYHTQLNCRKLKQEERMPASSKTPLGFSKFLRSKWLTDVKDKQLRKPTIVVNISNSDAVISGPPPRKVLKPRKSTILQGVSIISAQSVILITVPEGTNIGGMINEDNWCHLSALDPTYPWDVPLYKSEQFDVGSVEFDPYVVTESEQSSHGGVLKKYNIKVNVWFSPEKTNCGIHDHHTDPEMLEVHTQIYGTGRMQKFREKDFKALYEDVKMAPGFTHDPFAGVKESGDIFYGWHQYYSDTDCIWMAIEYHPA